MNENKVKIVLNVKEYFICADKNIDELFSDLNLKNDDTTVYVCGHPGMIEDVKEKLNPQNFEVIEERFWK